MAKNFTPIDRLLKKYQEQLSVSSSKEAEPALASLEKPEIKEAAQEQFVTFRPDTIELPPDLQRLGLKATPSSASSQYANVKLPISDDKIVVGLHSPISSSIRWLATLAVYILRQAHLGLKVVHGHVTRVIRR